MKYFTILFILFALICPVFAVIGGGDEYCGDPKVVVLIGGQHIDTGTVTVFNDTANLYVVYTTTGG